MSIARFREQSTPATPPANTVDIYPKANGLMYSKADDGVERPMSLGNGVVGPCQLDASVAGNGLSGGACTPLSVNVDGTTIEIVGDTLRAKAGGVITPSSVDNVTIEYASSQLRVKDLGISTTKIADNAVTSAKIAAAVAGSGLSGGGGSPLAVNVDGTTIEIVSDTLQVKAGSIGTGTLADGVPVLDERQGGSATDWASQGTTSQTLTKTRLKTGVKLVSFVATDFATATVTFAASFSGTPVVQLTPAHGAASLAGIVVEVIGVTASGFTIHAYLGTASTYSLNVNWLAIGPVS